MTSEKPLSSKVKEQILGFDNHLKPKRVHRFTYEEKDVRSAVESFEKKSLEQKEDNKIVHTSYWAGWNDAIIQLLA